MSVFKRTMVGSLVATLLLAVGGCSSGSSNDQAESSGADGSRVHLYSSVKEMAGDSSVVVIGTVAGAETVDDIDATTDFTVSDFSISQVVKGNLEPGASVKVRQLGSGDQAPPAELLEQGRTYLLYLTPSGLDGSLASQYYVTGGDAGLYVASGTTASSKSASKSGATSKTVQDVGTFAPLDPEPGEPLPSSLTQADALG